MKRLIQLPVRLVIGLALLAFVLSLLLPRYNAAALSNASIDTTHISAGTVVYQTFRDYIVSYCSGVLIAPQVFLTAGHCTDDINGYLREGLIKAAYVTFDTQVTQSSSLVPVTALITNPDYTTNPPSQNPHSDTHDLGVVLLATPMALSPVALPPEGLLDALNLKPHTPVTAVGYGLQSNDVRNVHSPFFALTDDGGIRSSGTLSLQLLRPAYLYVSEIWNQGSDNICYGDSGGPDFVQVNGWEQLVAINFWTLNSSCETHGILYRLDTPQARAFLGQYVTLP